MSAAPRSGFVTVLGWIFIVLSTFSTLVSLLQNLMVNFVFAQAGFDFDAIANAPGRGMPEWIAFGFRHMREIFMVTLAACALTLAASIGLLLRKNWARLLFIALMAIGIAWNIGGMVLMVSFFSLFSDAAAHAPENLAQTFKWMTGGIMAFNALLTIAFTVLFGWIIAKLASPGIKAEFVQAE